MTGGQRVAGLASRVRQVFEPSAEGLAARSIASSSSQVFVGNVLFVLLNTAQVIVIGAVFGTGRQYELFLLAWMVPELCLFGLGNVLHMHLTPVLLATRARHGEEQLRAACLAVSIHLVVFLIAACSLVWLVAPTVVAVVTAGLSAAELATTVAMFRLLLVAAFGLALVKHLGLLHRASHSLALPALVQAVAPVTVIVLVLLFPHWGVTAIIVAYACAAAVQILLLLAGPLSWGTLRSRAWRHPAVAGLVAGAVPLLVITSGFRLVVFLDRAAAAGLDSGDVAVLRYALFFLMGVQSLIAMPLISVGFNHLSHLASIEDHPAGRGAETVERAVLVLVEALWCLILPVACLLMVVPDELVQLVLGRRAFAADAITRTGTVLALLAAMLPVLACFMVAEKAFLSRRQHRFLFACAVLFPLSNLVLNRALSRTMGVSGVALATTLTMALWFLTLLGRLLTRVPAQDRAQLARSLATTTSIGLVTLVAMRALGDHLVVVGWWTRLATLGGLTLALFSALVWLSWRGRLALVYRTLTSTRVGQ